MSDNYLTAYYDATATYKIPEGIDIKSKDVRWWIKYNTLYIERRFKNIDGEWELEKHEIEGDFECDCKYPEDVNYTNEEQVEEDLKCYPYECGQEFSVRDERYSRERYHSEYGLYYTGAYKEEYSEMYEKEDDDEEDDSDTDETVEFDNKMEYNNEINNELKRGK